MNSFFSGAHGFNVAQLNQIGPGSHVEMGGNVFSNSIGGSPMGNYGRQDWPQNNQPYPAQSFNPPGGSDNSSAMAASGGTRPSSTDALSPLLTRPYRPGSIPTQGAEVLPRNSVDSGAGTSSQVPSQDLQYPVCAQEDLIPTPEYKIGVIRALDAQAHLTERTMGAIADVLKEAERSITANRWIAQTGFMHDRLEFSKVFKPEALYTSRNQIIVIQVFGWSSVQQSEADRLSERLSLLLGGFYGLLVWKKTVSVITPARPHKVPKDAALFGDETGEAHSGSFGGRPSASTKNIVSLKASNCESSPPSCFSTDIRFQPQAGANRDDQNTVVVGELTFKGPRGYQLQNASIQLTSDAACDFEIVQPAQRGLVQTDGTYKQTAQDTERKLRTTTLGAEASQSGGNVNASLSKETGEEHSTSTDETRNGVGISHDSGPRSARVTYTPLHPKRERTQLIVPRDDLPEVTISPLSSASNFKSVAIRTLSVWRAEQVVVRVPEFLERALAHAGLAGDGQTPEYRKDLDVIFCTEVLVPRHTQGLNSASPRIDVYL